MVQWSEWRHVGVGGGVEENMADAAEQCRHDRGRQGHAGSHVQEAARPCAGEVIPEASAGLNDRTAQEHGEQGHRDGGDEIVQDGVVRQVADEGKADQNFGVDDHLGEDEHRDAEVAGDSGFG